MRAVGFVQSLPIDAADSLLDLDVPEPVLSCMVRLVDDGTIKTTETEILSGLSAQTLKKAHQIIEKSEMVGKLVVDYATPES